MCSRSPGASVVTTAATRAPPATAVEVEVGVAAVVADPTTVSPHPAQEAAPLPLEHPELTTTQSHSPRGTRVWKAATLILKVQI